MKMNKKYMFGFLAFCMVAFVSAGLVSYLSNTVQADIEIKSPFEVGISSDTNEWGSSLELVSDFSGAIDPYTFHVKVTNLANEDITGIVKNLVKSKPVYDYTNHEYNYMACADFESVLAQTISTYPVDVVVPDRVTSGCTHTSGTFGTSEMVYTCNEYDLIEAILCNVIEEGGAGVDTVIQFGYGPNSATTNAVTFMPGQVDVTTVEAQLSQNVLGKYTFTTQVVSA